MNHKRSHAATSLSEGFNGGEFELIFSRKKIAMQTKEKIVPFLSFHLNSVIQVSSGRWIYAGIADKPGGRISGKRVNSFRISSQIAVSVTLLFWGSQRYLAESLTPYCITLT